MKRFMFLCILLVLVATPDGAWAGPAEEIAEIARERAKAYREGNLDGWVAAFADNATFQTALVPFRMEGKEAIKAYFAGLFERYPTRSFVSRQPLVRVYGTDTTVVTNGYTHVTLVERNGQVNNLFIRTSVTWVKMGGQWRIVDQHLSKLPQ